jgi:hypothetical protein
MLDVDPSAAYKSNRVRRVSLQRPRVWTFVGALIACLGVALGAKNVDDQRPGQKVLALMIRALATTLPEKLPEQYRKKAAEHAIREYEQDLRLVPGEGFFEPEFLRHQDPGLYRDLRRLWSLKPSRQLEAVPELGEHYFREQRPLQQMILRFVSEVSEDAFDVAEREALVEPVYLQILDRGSSREDRLEILENDIGKLRVTATGYRKLLELANHWRDADPELRVALIRALAQGRNDIKQPADVGHFLLGVAAHDSSVECRRAAISYWQIVYLGRETVVPTYLLVLDDSLQKEDWVTASTVIRVVGIQWKDVAATPDIIRVLGATDPGTRAIAITALENMVDMDMASIPTDVQVFSIDYDKPTIDPDALTRLDRAASRWKAWWDEEGKVVLDREGVDEFKRRARDIYWDPL